MKPVKKALALIGAAALILAIGAVPGANAAHGGAYTVGVGAPLDDIPQAGGDVSASSMRFLSPTLNVHKGDTITFQGGFDTATALPVGEDPSAWVAENMALLAPWSLAVGDDEGANTFKFNDAIVYPTGGFQCGIGTAPPCTYDGTTEVNSGFLFLSTQFGETGPTGGFTMEVDANAGDSFYVISLVHQNMRMQVNVIQSSENTSSQGDIDTYAQTQVIQDAETANAIDNDYDNKIQSRRLKNGHRLYQAWAGVDYGEVGGGVSVFDIYPDKLNLKKGDKVKYNFDQLLFELHSSTYPKSEALRLSSGFGEPVCDPDGTTGTAPDTAPNPDMTCTEGALEFDLDTEGFAVLGDGKWTGTTDVESSGVRGPYLPGGVTQEQLPWKQKFAKKTGDKAAKFVCLLHPWMVQSVVVRDS